MVSQQIAPREERGSDSHSDYTHSSLADSNYSLISGDEAAILTDDDEGDDQSSSFDPPRSVASFDDDEEIAASRLDSSIDNHLDPDVDEVDESLIDDHDNEDQSDEEGSGELLPRMDDSLVTPTVASLNLDTPITTAAHIRRPWISYFHQAGHAFRLPSNGTFRLLFHGPHGAMKQNIISKIAQTISIYRQPTDSAVPEASTFSVVPISDFENADSTPEVELIPSNGLHFVVHHCINCDRCGSSTAPKCTALQSADLEIFLRLKRPLSNPFSVKPSFRSRWLAAMPSIQVVVEPFEHRTGCRAYPNEYGPRSIVMLHDLLHISPFVLNRHLASLQEHAHLPCKAAKLRRCIQDTSEAIRNFKLPKVGENWQQDLSLNMRLAWLELKRPLHSSYPYLNMMSLLFLSIIIPVIFTEYWNSRFAGTPWVSSGQSPLDQMLSKYSNDKILSGKFSTGTTFAPTGLSEVLPAHYTYSGKPPREWSYKQPWKPETAPVRVYLQPEEGAVYLSILPDLVAKGLTPVVLASSNEQALPAKLEQQNKTMFAVRVNANYKTQPLDLRVISALKSGTVDDLFQIRIKHKTSLMALSSGDFLPKRSELSRIVGKELMVLQRNARRIATKTSKQVDDRLKRLNKESKALIRLSARGFAVQEERLMHLCRELRQEQQELRRWSKGFTKEGKKLISQSRVKLDEIRRHAVADFHLERRAAAQRIRNLPRDANYMVNTLFTHLGEVEKWLTASEHPTLFAAGEDDRDRSVSFYKSKSLGKWRAFARRIVNRAAGRKIYTHGLDHDA